MTNPVPHMTPAGEQKATERGPLKPMPAVWLDKLKAIAQEYDEDFIAVFVLHGSEDRGLALGVWSAFEGDDAMPRTVALLDHALYEDDQEQAKESGQS